MDGAKPGTKPLRPAGPAAVPAAPGPAPATAPNPAPATPAQSRVARSFESVSTLRPAPLARAGFGAGVGASTVFGARIQQFNTKNAPPPAEAPGSAFQSMGRMRARHADLQERALGDKGLKPESVADVLEFMETVARSGRHFEDEGQRAAMSQVLGFWARQVGPLVDRPLGIELADYAG